MTPTAGVAGEHGKASFSDILIALVCGLALVNTAVALATLPVVGHFSSSCDFLAYWSTGSQLAHHANPYDPVQMDRIEHAIGFVASGAYYMRNPPWALPLVLPLGWTTLRIAVLPWSLLMLTVLVLSVRIFGNMLGPGARPWQMLGYAFPPALLCVIVGQTSLLPVLGVILFFRLHRTHPMLAGAALWLCTLKPHLFLPFAVALLAWVFVARAGRVLLGAGAAALLSCLATLAVDPSAFSQYLHWARSSGISTQRVTCLAFVFRNVLDPSATWLIFVPCVLGCIWAAWFFSIHRHHWDWIEHGSLLLLVSMVVAPYSFLFDQAVALPAILCAASRAPSPRLVSALAVLFFVVEFQPLLASAPAVAYWVWSLAGPAWLVWFLLAHAAARRNTPAPISQPA